MESCTFTSKTRKPSISIDTECAGSCLFRLKLSVAVDMATKTDYNK